MADYSYEIIRSSRKTLLLQVRKDGSIVVRAPRRTTKAWIRRFVDSNHDWVDRRRAQLSETQRQADAAGLLSQEELRQLAEQAKRIIPQRVAYYAPLVGVTYGRITIRHQKTRWGSCSAKGNLNFNCLLMLTPPEVLDSVVVHELCHRKEMNHSRRFYDEVLRVFPQYHQCDRWLKKNGPTLLRRMTGGAEAEAGSD